MITIDINNHRCKINGNLDPEIIKEIDKKLSYFVQGFQFMNVSKKWDGRHRLLTKYRAFPIGLLHYVEGILNKNGISYQKNDCRSVIPLYKKDEIVRSPKYILRDYQQEVVDTALREGSGIVMSPTGSGKTLILSEIASRYKTKAIIYVISIDLLYQMEETIKDMFPDKKVGLIGDGNCSDGDIIVATIWSVASAHNKKAEYIDSPINTDSAKKNKGLNKAFVRDVVKKAGVFIFDECQLVGSPTGMLIHNKSINARHRFLFSATPWRESGDDLLIEAVGGKRIVSIRPKDLIDTGWLMPPKIFFVKVKSMRGIGKTYSEVYKNYITNNEFRNDLVLKAALKLKKMGRRTVIATTHLNHAENICKLLDGKLVYEYISGASSSDERKAVFQKMRNGEIDVLVGTRVVNVGIDIPELDALILAGPIKSSIISLQRIGRVIRKAEGKKNAIIIDFFDQARFLRNHSKKRKQIYLLNEFKVEDLD